MRRRHNVILATILVIGIIFLFAHEQEHGQDDVDHVSQLRKPRESQRPGYSTHTVSEEVPLFHETPSTSPFPQELLGHSDVEDVSPPADHAESNDVPELPSSEVTFPPPDSNLEPSPFEAEYPFQNDLELEMPVLTLKELNNYNPHNYDRNGPKTYAFATFMATRNPSLKDPYFLAIHSLIYRILWSPRSRTIKYPFVVYVADFVTPEQRALLSGAGAVVRELAPLEWSPNVPGVQKRWKDLFAKLNMWNETEFERILFLDADAFPMANIDEMFDIAPVKDCEASKLQLDDFPQDGMPVCEPYIFAGVPQDPHAATISNINVGSMVFTPSKRMHQRLLQNYVKTDKYDCLMAEQAFLDWQFGPDGAYPASALDRQWGGFFPQENEEGKLKVVHEKIWVAAEGWTKREWDITWEEMLQYYASLEFLEARAKDGMSPTEF